MAADSNFEAPNVAWYEEKNPKDLSEGLKSTSQWEAGIVQASEYSIPKKFWIWNNYNEAKSEASLPAQRSTMITCRISVRDFQGGVGQGSGGQCLSEELGNHPTDDPNSWDWSGNAITGPYDETSAKDGGTRAIVFMCMYKRNAPGGGQWGYWNGTEDGATFIKVADGNDGKMPEPDESKGNRWQVLNAHDPRLLSNAAGEADSSSGRCDWLDGTSRICNPSVGTDADDSTKNFALVALALYAKPTADAGTIKWRTRVSYQFR